MPAAHITLKETPLAAAHCRLGARMVDFAGWSMPVQYQSIIAEHKAVRSGTGLFDVSHMGEFSVSGPGAVAFLQYMVANDLEKLSAPNRALYTQLLNETGGTVDDLIVYRRAVDYLLVVNASNIDKDYDWLENHLRNFRTGTISGAAVDDTTYGMAPRGAPSSAAAKAADTVIRQSPSLYDVHLHNLSDKIALLSLQGLKSAALLSVMSNSHLTDLPSFTLAETIIGNIPVEVARTGYTGEDGFEIFVNPEQAEQLWYALLEAGREYGIQPCGLGARDTLRLEAALPLYGHELDEQTSPLEAGLGWSVKLNKGNFVGKHALEAQRAEGLKKQCVCLKCEGKALPRQGYRVFADGDVAIGTVTSGSQGIYVGYPIAMAYVPPQYATVGTRLSIEIRDSQVPCEVVSRPFYKRPRSR